MKNLLDFFEEDMLYRAESAPARRFDRSMVQSAKDVTVHVGAFVNAHTVAGQSRSKVPKPPY